MKRLVAAALGIACWATAGASAAPDRDPAREAKIAERVSDLLSRMTPEEKIGQLTLQSNRPGFDFDAVRRGEVGSVVAFTSGTDIRAVQAAAAQSRLGIPLLIGLDVVHGLRTIFPIPLGEAASFNPDLARRVAESSARDAAAMGYNWTFAPDADMARDPRWGRIAEGFGEDPLLGRAFTAARVAGYRAGGLGATLKHFVGYGAAVGGRDYDAASIPTSDLLDLYVPPFAAGITAGAEFVMPAFSTLNGVPSTADPALIGGMLRRRLGFDGAVVSDWTAIEQLIAHGVAQDGPDAARKALAAGIDIDMASGLYGRDLKAEIKEGRIPADQVDAAARRVLTAKARLGMLDREPVAPVAPGAPPLPSADSRELAREAARDSTVLLRNTGILPLRPGGTVAVVGGMARNGRDLTGPHAASVHVDDAVTILDGISRRAAAAGTHVVAAAGCDSFCRDRSGFEEALAVARQADTIVTVLGEPLDWTGEGASRAHLTLPGEQSALLQMLVATGKPVILVLLSSRPVELGPVVDGLTAILMAWFPGTEGGNALADLLFGDVSPSGKLPLSWPATVGQVPVAYDRLPTGRPAEPGNRFTLGYVDAPLRPLYPFGFGLTYAAFRFSDLSLASERVSAAGTVSATVRLRNDSAVPASDVVQLYVRPLGGSRSRPVRRLVAFAKVAVSAGDSRMVTLSAPAHGFGFHDDAGVFHVEQGRYQLFVGDDSDATLSTTVEVTP